MTRESASLNMHKNTCKSKRILFAIAHQLLTSPLAKPYFQYSFLFQVLVEPCNLTLGDIEAVGSFPRRFKLDPNGARNGPVGWMLSDIQDWMKNPAGTIRSIMIFHSNSSALVAG